MYIFTSIYFIKFIYPEITIFYGTSFLDDPRFPVKIFKEFIRRRPEDCLAPDIRFYLGILPFRKIVTDLEHREACWFSKQAMGTNTMGNIVNDWLKRVVCQDEKQTTLLVKQP